MVGRPEQDEPSTALVHRPLASPIAALVRVLDASRRVLNLRDGRCLVGSDASCDLVLFDSTVSREHVELELVPEGVRVRDLGSKNGTFYLGQRVESITLALGGRVEVGNTSISIEADAAALHNDLSYPHSAYGELVSVSLAMKRLCALVQRLEGSLATVLIEGESGAGKDVVANVIHESSAVAKGPFVAMNCGAVSRELVKSELFGHRRGAFSGAVEDRRGAFEMADGGTLFLDEIGELPLELQPMLLRAIERGEVMPVGADKSKVVRVRLLLATNRDLHEDVRNGRFRQDLFYRIAVVRLSVPPLRERREDIVPLAQHFANRAGGESLTLPDEVLSQLTGRDWPGNVRELKNVVDAFVALRILPEPQGGRASHEGRLSAAEALGAMVDWEKPYLDARDELIEQFSREYLDRLLERAGGNQTQAARLAGLDRTYLGRLLAKYGLR